MTVNRTNIARTLSATQHAISAERELYVMALLIIDHSASVQKHTSEVPSQNVVQNVTVMLTVHPQNQHVFMESVRIHAMELVV